eukprot:360771-Chlamydomonas_euryale.AAC.6
MSFYDRVAGPGGGAMAASSMDATFVTSFKSRLSGRKGVLTQHHGVASFTAQPAQSGGQVRLLLCASGRRRPAAVALDIQQ